MRWDGHQWIDEGRLPIVYEARVLAEDTSGVLWVGGTDGKLLRIGVPPSGLREAKAEVISKAKGVPEGSVFPAFIDGALYAAPGLSKDMLR